LAPKHPRCWCLLPPKHPHPLGLMGRPERRPRGHPSLPSCPMNQTQGGHSASLAGAAGICREPRAKAEFVTLGGAESRRSPSKASRSRPPLFRWPKLGSSDPRHKCHLQLRGLSRASSRGCSARGSSAAAKPSPPAGRARRSTAEPTAPGWKPGGRRRFQPGISGRGGEQTRGSEGFLFLPESNSWRGSDFISLVIIGLAGYPLEPHCAE